ncbi:MAG: helicase-related protein [Candidatus Woesearchaeota archaeon]
MQSIKIEEKSGEPVINLALDTISKKKQALVFVNAKRSAEKCAEEISKKIKETNPELTELSEKALGALSRPTKQCERLALCLKKGVAFHHAGLHSKQKEIIEENFKKGKVKIICCTPTLAAGVDLPAFRSIIRDVKRYTNMGMQYIPVLEYLQMAGRAGRPSFDTHGEAILITGTEPEKKAVYEKFVLGEPEEIYSKLAVEPVLRTYLLSLISTKVIQSPDEIYAFFGKTFWAHQFKDTAKLRKKIDQMLKLLEEWKFIQLLSGSYRATLLGKRVAELYIDPLTANHFIHCMQRAKDTKITPLSLLVMISNTLEMAPQLRVKTKEYDDIQEQMAKHEVYMLDKEPSMFEPEYEDYINAFKTAMMFDDWINEKDEEQLLEQYDIRPGETRAKLERAEWLLYALSEIARINQQQFVLKDIAKLRFRLKHGAKEELIPLLKLKNIGRVRARKLFRAGIKDLRDVKTAQLEQLSVILGSKKIALGIKQQVGEKIEEETEGTLKKFR